MHFANCAALAAVLFTTLTQNLRFCSSAEGFVQNVTQRLLSRSRRTKMKQKKSEVTLFYFLSVD